MHETPIIGGPRHVFEAVMGDLHACSYGRPGSGKRHNNNKNTTKNDHSLLDLAHFLVTSTTREFRKTYLDTVINAYVNQLDDVLESQGKKKKQIKQLQQSTTVYINANSWDD
jgi:hypothetical protein